MDWYNNRKPDNSNDMSMDVPQVKNRKKAKQGSRRAAQEKESHKNRQKQKDARIRRANAEQYGTWEDEDE